MRSDLRRCITESPSNQIIRSLKTPGFEFVLNIILILRLQHLLQGSWEHCKVSVFLHQKNWILNLNIEDNIILSSTTSLCRRRKSELEFFSFFTSTRRWWKKEFSGEKKVFLLLSQGRKIFSQKPNGCWSGGPDGGVFSVFSVVAHRRTSWRGVKLFSWLRTFISPAWMKGSLSENHVFCCLSEVIFGLDFHLERLVKCWNHSLLQWKHTFNQQLKHRSNRWSDQSLMIWSHRSVSPGPPLTLRHLWSNAAMTPRCREWASFTCSVVTWTADLNDFSYKQLWKCHRFTRCSDVTPTSEDSCFRLFWQIHRRIFFFFFSLTFCVTFGCWRLVSSFQSG